MIEKLLAYNTAQVTFVRKLAEYCAGCTPHGILKVDRISQIHSECNSVDDDINPFAYYVVCMILLLMPREKHEYNIERIGV